MTRQLRGLIGAVAVISTSTVLTLLLLEAVIRFIAPQDAVLWVDSTIEMIEPAGADTPYMGDADLGLTLKPGVHYRNSAPEFSIDVRANSLGYRAAEFPSERTKPRVVVTGDSFSWGHGVEADERAVDLIAARSPQYEWLNLSVPGTGTDQHLFHFRKNGQRLKPDIVVEFIYPNDLVDNLRSFRYFAKPRFELEPDGSLKLMPVGAQAEAPKKTLLPVDRFLRNRSHLYALLKGKVMMLRAARGGAGERTEDVLGFYRRQRDPGMEQAGNLLKAILSEYAREAASTGARFAVVLVPHKWEMSTSGRYIKDDWATTVRLLGLKDSDYDLESFSREVTEWAAAEQVPCLDLLQYLRPQETGSEFVYFPRDGHWTREGNRLVADAFIRHLWPALEAQPSGPDRPISGREHE